MADNEEKNTENTVEENSDVRAKEADKSTDTPQHTSGGGNSAVFAILAILILIGGLVFYFATRKPTAKLATMLEVLPQENLVLATVDLGKVEDREIKGNVWNKIKEMETFKQLIAEFEAEEKINLEEDVLSWIGETFTVAVFKNTKDGEESYSMDNKASFAVLVSVRDMETAEKKVPELLKKAETNYSEEIYENTKIMVPENSEDAPTLSFFRGMLIVGNSPGDIKKCIDAANGKTKALKNNDKVTSSLNKLPPNSVITFYVDLAAIILDGPGAENIKENPEIEKFFNSLDGIAIGMGIKKNGDLTGTGFVGIKRQSESIIAKALVETRTDVGVPATAKLFPKDTTQYAVFDVKYLYGIIMKFAEAQDGGKEQFEMMKELMKTQIGIDLDKDVFDNLSGEAAYSINMLDMLQHQMQATLGTGFSQYEYDLKQIITALEVHSTSTDGGYPETLEALVPDYLENVPQTPPGLTFLYKATANPPSYNVGYTTDGKNLSTQYPSYDSNKGMIPDPNKTAGANQQAPVVIAIRLKDKAKIQEVINKLLTQAEGMIQSTEHADVKLYMLPEGAGGFGIYDDFFLLGLGKGIDRVKSIIDNKMDESKSLASLDSFREIQGKLTKNTLTVGFINFESILPILEMGLVLQAAQGGNEHQQITKELLGIAKQYTNVWSYSELESGGIKFDFTAMQDKKAGK
jgi:hypothetical protein